MGKGDPVSIQSLSPATRVCMWELVQDLETGCGSREIALKDCYLPDSTEELGQLLDRHGMSLNEYQQCLSTRERTGQISPTDVMNLIAASVPFGMGLGLLFIAGIRSAYMRRPAARSFTPAPGKNWSPKARLPARPVLFSGMVALAIAGYLLTRDLVSPPWSPVQVTWKSALVGATLSVTGVGLVINRRAQITTLSYTLLVAGMASAALGALMLLGAWQLVQLDRYRE
jgi:hypothetical protein